MLITAISDLHTECYYNHDFLKNTKILDYDADVCVLAGDIGNPYTASSVYESVLNQLCNHFPQVIIVPGNHEWWYSDKKNIIAFYIGFEAQRSNFRALIDEPFVYNGQRFIGNTLWFPKGKITEDMEHDWIDFNRGITPTEVYKKNAATMKFFANEMDSNDVVITHHAPSAMSISRKYFGNPWNCFYTCYDAEQLILTKQPKLWIHGHHHHTSEYKIKNTKVFCNPYGYATELHTGFCAQPIEI